MKTVMVYPNEKEKAIYNYSEDLIKETETEGLTFTGGKPFSFPFYKSLSNKQIHIQHEYNLLGWYGLPFQFILLFYKLCFKKLILTMHTVISKESKRIGFMRYMFYNISNFIIRICANKIIVHSQVFKNLLIKDYRFEEERISVIRHGVKEVPKFDKEKIKKELGLKGKVSLIIGTFHPDHQPHLIINQTNKIGKEVVVVFNSGRLNNKCLEYFGNINKKSCRMIDIAKEHKDKWWEFFYAADLVILPYIDGIGSGIFQDAMATRTPVVCSDTEYFREMLEDYNCGAIAFNDNDYPRAIEFTMENLSRLKVGCNMYADKYSVKNMAKKTLGVYNENN